MLSGIGSDCARFAVIASHSKHIVLILTLIPLLAIITTMSRRPFRLKGGLHAHTEPTVNLEI